MMAFVNRFFSIEVLKETVQRFPLSAACMVGMFVVAIAQIHDIIDLEDETNGRLVIIFSSLYLWFGAAKLIVESRQFKTTLIGIPLVFVACGLFLLLALSPLFWIHYFLVLPSLLLALVFAPYLFGGDDWSFWRFNRDLWLGVAISFLAAGLFCGGLMAALGAIDHLFGVDVPEELYGDIAVFATTILGPIYALSRVPKKFDYSEEDVEAPVGLRFIANWVSVPIVFVYLLILYAYFIKIIVTGEVPSGYLAYMITGFVGSGVLTYLVAWPLRGRKGGLPQLQLFYKVFFPALFIPVGFHFFAIWERVSAYGITEQRYAIIVSAVWFLIIAIAMSLPRRVPLKVIPASLCMLLALSSFGPWGAVNVSGKSQFARLESLLVKHELLKDGKVVSAKDGYEIPFDDRKSMGSILGYLCRSDRDDMIEPWFNVENKPNWTCSGGYKLAQQLGFEYKRYYRERDRFDINAVNNRIYAVKGYDYLVPSVYAHVLKSKDGMSWSDDRNFPDHNVAMVFDRQLLKITVDEFEPVVVDVPALIEGKSGVNLSIEELTVLGQNSDLSYKVSFPHVRGGMKDGKLVPDGMRFDFFFKITNSKAKQ